jgi:hypothetical protein
VSQLCLRFLILFHFAKRKYLDSRRREKLVFDIPFH